MVLRGGTGTIYYGCDGGSCRRAAVGIRVPGYYYGCDGSCRRAAVGIPSLHQSVHSIHRRFGEKEVELITELATGNCSFDALSMSRRVCLQNRELAVRL